MGMDGFILDLESFRERKQAQGEENAKKLYQKAFTFIERKANIREKVRAKTIFRNLVDLPYPIELSDKQDKQFMDWFLFDYVTIQGTTMFNFFLKQQRDSLTEPELILGALFLSAVLDVVKVESIDVQEKEILVKEFYTNRNQFILYEEEIRLLKADKYYFVRKIPLMKRELAIGSMYEMKRESLENMKREFEIFKKINHQLSWRAYLKQNAVKFIHNPT